MRIKNSNRSNNRLIQKKFGKFVRLSFFLILSLSIFLPFASRAQQSVYVDASTLIPKSILFLSPSTATILEGSTIDVPVFINTEGNSINTIHLSVNFDPTKMIITRPSNINSIIGIYVDPPTFSNTDGSMELSGVIPNGITTGSGLITTITFKAISAGQATVSISDSSKVLANDGQGTEVETQFDTGVYTIIPQSPGGPNVFSETHPFQDMWYNNNSPQVAWSENPGVTDFSYILDDKPFTIPDNNMNSTSTFMAYQNLSDGIWYFHIKEKKEGVWGLTTNFMIRIDTSPPAAFKPEVSFLTSSSSRQVLVSFFTTDSLSGLDHYEVGIVPKNGINESPAFVQTSSPYQFSLQPSEEVRIIVRAFDKAGNSLDESVDTNSPSGTLAFFEQNYLIILLLLILLIDFLFGHKLIPHIGRIIKAVEKEEKEEKLCENKIESSGIVETKIDSNSQSKMGKVKFDSGIQKSEQPVKKEEITNTQNAPEIK
jgi:hypothetical protein